MKPGPEGRSPQAQVHRAVVRATCAARRFSDEPGRPAVLVPLSAPHRAAAEIAPHSRLLVCGDGRKRAGERGRVWEKALLLVSLFTQPFGLKLRYCASPDLLVVLTLYKLGNLGSVNHGSANHE